MKLNTPTKRKATKKSGPTKPKQQTTPSTAKTPDKPKRRSVGAGDKFALPLFISKADRENFYFRYMLETRWPDYKEALYEKVIHPDTKKEVRKASKDSEEDLILVKLPNEYRNEDVQLKRERANAALKKKRTEAGVEVHDVTD